VKQAKWLTHLRCGNCRELRECDEKAASNVGAVPFCHDPSSATRLQIPFDCWRQDRIPSRFERTDTEIAQAAVAALKWNTLAPHDHVTVAVANGWITLSGQVNWNYQKDAIARAVRDLNGVKGILNNIAVQPAVKTTDVRDKIEAAFRRSAEVDARRISVAAEDGKVILSGNVHSWAERQEAERAAWAAPGVKQVDDRLAVGP
jgi:osmotically-inducible protein OsmY